MVTEEKITQITDWGDGEFIVLTDKGRLFYGYLPYEAYKKTPMEVIWTELSLPPLKEEQ